MDATERMATATYTAPVNDQPLASGENLRKHGFLHRIASYGVQLAALEVTLPTGETEVCELLSCIDAGRVPNPQLYEQQVQAARHRDWLCFVRRIYRRAGPDQDRRFQQLYFADLARHSRHADRAGQFA